MARAGGEGFQAAVVAAGAAGSRGLDRHVTELAAGALRAAHQDAVGYHAATYPGPQRDEDQVVGLAADPEPELAPRRRVAVVLYREGQPDLGLELVLQGYSFDGVQVRGEDDLVLAGEDQTGHGEAHPSDLVAVPDLCDGLGDVLDQGPRRVRRGVADLVQDLALGGDDPGGDLGPPHVHPDGVHRPAFQSTISSSARPE